MRVGWLAWAWWKISELESAQARYFAAGPGGELPAEGLEALEDAEAAVRRLVDALVGDAS